MKTSPTLLIPLLMTAGCSVSGLVELGRLCADNDPAIGNNCGECGVIVCSDGTFSCAEAPSVRRDLRVSLAAPVASLVPNGLQTSVRINGGKWLTLEPTADGFVGCIPGLNESRNASGEVRYVVDEVTLASFAFTTVAFDPGITTDVDPEQWPLALPDDDRDGAKNLFEVALSGVDVARDSTRVPAGFLSEVIDLVANPEALSLRASDREPLPGNTPLAVAPQPVEAGLLVVSTQLGPTGDLDLLEVARWRDGEVRGAVNFRCAPGFVKFSEANLLVGCSDDLLLVTGRDPYVVNAIDLPAGFLVEQATVESLQRYLVAVRQDSDRFVYLAGPNGSALLAALPPMQQVTQMAYRRDLGAFVVDASGKMHWFEPSGFELLTVAEVPGNTAIVTDGLAIAGSTLWVTTTNPAAVQVFTIEQQPTPTLVPVASIPLARPPRGVFVDPVSNTWIYVLDEGGIERINRWTFSVEDRISFGGELAPRALGNIAFGTDGTASMPLGAGAVQLGHRSDAVTSTLADARQTFDVPPSARRVYGVVRRGDDFGETYPILDFREPLLERLRFTIDEPSLLFCRSMGNVQVSCGPLPNDMGVTLLDFTEPYRQAPPMAWFAEPGTHEIGLSILAAAAAPYLIEQIRISPDLPNRIVSPQSDRSLAPVQVAPIRIQSWVDTGSPILETTAIRYDPGDVLEQEAIEAFFDVFSLGETIVYLDWSRAPNAGALGDLQLYVMGTSPGQVLHKSPLTFSGNRQALRIFSPSNLLIGVSGEDFFGTPEMDFDLYVLPVND